MKHFSVLNTSDGSRRGGAMVMATFAISLVSVLAMSMVSIQFSGAVEQNRTHQEARAVLAAEAGLSQAYMAMQNGRSGNLGAVNQPLNLASGNVCVTTQAYNAPSQLVRVTANATAGSAAAGAELILRDNVNTLFRYGAFGDSTLDLSSQAKVDSYDSTLGTYAAQAVNGSGAGLWASDKGDIGSNGNISLMQNALVMGDAIPGQSSTITVRGNAVVSGSTANATSAVTLPPIVVPAIPSLGAMTFSTNTTIPSGSYHYGSTVVNGTKTVTVIGPATLVFDSFEMKSRSNFNIDSTNGPVDIYVIDNFIMNSNTILGSLDHDPRDVRLNLLSDNIIDPGILVKLDNLTLDSNGQLFGTIYAPDAKVDIESNFEVFGAVIAEQVILASNSRVHYDESLSRVLAPGQQRYTCLSWRAIH